MASRATSRPRPAQFVPSVGRAPVVAVGIVVLFAAFGWIATGIAAVAASIAVVVAWMLATAGRSATGDRSVDVSLDISTDGAGLRVELSGPAGRSVIHEPACRLPTGRGTDRLHELLRSSSSSSFASARETAVRRFGSELFDAVFDGDVLDRYRRHVDLARRHGRTLRLTITTDHRLAQLPWEYLHDPGRSTFLAASTGTAVVRRPTATAAPVSATQAPIEVLRVLLIAASPGYLQPLAVDHEQNRVLEALGPAIAAGLVEVETVERATLADLHAALERFEPHVFYFAGHGRWDADADEGAIVLLSRRGRPEGVSGRRLGTLLNRPHLRLAVLNGCETSRVGAADPFAGVAGALVAQGVPAVVGNQFRFEDRAGAVFGESLLRSLAEGVVVDEAVQTARRAICAMPNDVEWATPTLLTVVPPDHLLPRALPAGTKQALPQPTSSRPAASGTASPSPAELML